MMSVARIIIIFVFLGISCLFCEGRRRLFSEYKEAVHHRKHIFDINTSIDIDNAWYRRRKLSAVVSKVNNYQQHHVTSLPGLSPDDNRIVNYAGHVTINEKLGANIFYWLFEKPDNPLDAPLVIWLNGGPGCSSMDGLFLEIGPYRLSKSRSAGTNDQSDVISLNPYSWHTIANLLIVDQPVETGLSFVNSPRGLAGSDAQVNEQFYQFLLEFCKLHQRYTGLGSSNSSTNTNGDSTNKSMLRSRPIVLAGESHAGHYIPHMAAYIRKKNLEVSQSATNSQSSSGLYIDLDGLILGNPWIDPIHQYDVSTYAHAFGIITSGQKRTLKELNKDCQASLRKGRYNVKSCYSLLDLVMESSSVGNGAPRVSMYDVRKFLTKANEYPPGHEDVERFLNRVDVRTAIHATAKPGRFVECADPPFNALVHQDGQGVTSQVTSELNAGMRILLFSGQFDIVCNHLGSEYTLSRLDWKGRVDWLKAQRGIWMVNGAPAGYVKTFQNLQYLIVLNAGHMVPMDVPNIALNMLSKFVTRQPFGSGLARIAMSPALRDDLEFSGDNYNVALANKPSMVVKQINPSDLKIQTENSIITRRDTIFESSQDTKVIESIFESIPSDNSLGIDALPKFSLDSQRDIDLLQSDLSSSCSRGNKSDMPESPCNAQWTIFLNLSDKDSDKKGQSSWLTRALVSEGYRNLIGDMVFYDVLAAIKNGFSDSNPAAGKEGYHIPVSSRRGSAQIPSINRNSITLESSGLSRRITVSLLEVYGVNLQNYFPEKIRKLDETESLEKDEPADAAPSLKIKFSFTGESSLVLRVTRDLVQQSKSMSSVLRSGLATSNMLAMSILQPYRESPTHGSRQSLGRMHDPKNDVSGIGLWTSLKSSLLGAWSQPANTGVANSSPDTMLAANNTFTAVPSIHNITIVACVLVVALLIWTMKQRATSKPGVNAVGSPIMSSQPTHAFKSTSVGTARSAFTRIRGGQGLK